MNSNIHQIVNRIIRFCLVLVVLVISGTAFGADRVENLYNKAAIKYHRLYDDPVYASKTDNWLITIKQFRLIHQNYPNHYRSEYHHGLTLQYFQYLQVYRFLHHCLPGRR